MSLEGGAGSGVLGQAPLPLAEWRSGVAGHLILSDEDVTSEVQGLWRRLNTLQHYKVGGWRRVWGAGGGTGRLEEGLGVWRRGWGGWRRGWGAAGRGVTSCGQQVPDGATVALVPCLTKHALRENQDYVPGESECSPRPLRLPCPVVVPGGGERTWTSGWVPPFHPEEPPQVPPTRELAGPRLGRGN